MNEATLTQNAEFIRNYIDRYLNVPRSPKLSTHKIARHMVLNTTGWKSDKEILTTQALWTVTRPYPARSNPNGDPIPQ